MGSGILVLEVFPEQNEFDEKILGKNRESVVRVGCDQLCFRVSVWLCDGSGT